MEHGNEQNHSHPYSGEKEANLRCGQTMLDITLMCILYLILYVVCILFMYMV